MAVSDYIQYPTGNLCNANTAVRALDAAIKPLIPGKRIAGRAITARISPGQNAAIHRAVDRAQAGDILIVDGGQSTRFGPFGDLLADFCLQQGIVGGVFDCTVRDKADIAALGFQIFCRGFHPEATVKTEAGDIQLPVTLGDVTITPGDVIVGDDDGVVVIPASLQDTVLKQVAQVAANEETIRARIRSGQSTCDLFNIKRG